MKNLISVIIVNYNGKKWLKGCLDSLKKQSYKNFEIVFVENGSSDDSASYIKKNYPEVNLVISKKNLGFAGGNNLGLKKAKGKYVLLLNNDVVVTKDFLKNFIKVFDDHPNAACVQSKIRLLNDKSNMDTCGSFWTDSSFLYHYGGYKNHRLKKYNKEFPVFCTKGASMLIRKDVIEKIGLFDDDFWCYYEETDFCHRVWLLGYECWYYPKAVMYHAVGGTTINVDNDYIQYHNFKNKLMSFIKNFEIGSLIKIIPVYFFINFMLSFVWLFQGKFGHFISIYRAIYWNIVNLKKTLKKRSKIQKIRKASDVAIGKKVKFNPRLSYYYYLFTGLYNYKD